MLSLNDGLNNLIFEARVRKDQVTYLIGLPVSKVGVFEGMVNNTLSGTKLLPYKSELREKVHAAYDIDQTGSVLSLQPDVLGNISRTILSSMSNLTDKDDEVVLQVVVNGHYAPRATSESFLDPTRATFLDKLLGYARPASHEMVQSYKARYDQHGFMADVRLGIVCYDPKRIWNIYSNAMMGLRMLESVGARLTVRKIDPIKINGALLPKRKCLNLSCGEMLGVLAWPYGEMSLPILQQLHPQVLPPPRYMELYNPGRNFAISTYEGTNCWLGIYEKSAVFHSYFLGPTGCGKSNAMLDLIVADMRANRPVMVLDPKADLVNDVLKYVPTDRLKDVVIIDPLTACPVGINPFAAVKSGADPEMVMSFLLAAFKKVSGASWGKRMEDILRSCLLTLAKTPDSNLLMLPALLTDAKFRKKITAPIIKQDPVGLGRYWQQFEALSDNLRSQYIQPVMARLREFTLREPLRYMFGQTAPKFDMNDLFTKNKIVLVSLNKGKLGGDIANLIGMLIMSQIWSLTLSRPEHQRHLVNIYIDEVQNFMDMPVDLDEILSQARSFGVGFTLANQYLGQLSKDLTDAILANVANLGIFGLYSNEDCVKLSKHSGDLLAPDDFKYLPAFNLYFRTLIGKDTAWISGKTFLPTGKCSEPEELRKLSQQLYGVKRAEVDQANLEQFNFEKDVAELIRQTAFGIMSDEEDEADDD
jgi:hypothetical protein